jgi:hypothetical protein
VRFRVQIAYPPSEMQFNSQANDETRGHARRSLQYGDRIPITKVSPRDPARNARLGRKG